MKQIILTQGYYALVDDDMYGWINRWKWCVSKSSNKGYAVRRNEKTGKSTWMHRLIMNTPEGMDTDHKNGNKLDNRRCNLRVCTRSQNSQNRHKIRGVSRYKGVYRDTTRNKWSVIISINKRRMHVGRFDSEIEAAKAYDAKAIELFGDFAHTNFTQGENNESSNVNGSNNVNNVVCFNEWLF